MTGRDLAETRRRIGRQRGQPLSSKELAQRLDVPFSTYRRWEATDGLIPRHAAALVRSYLLLLDQQRCV